MNNKNKFNALLTFLMLNTDNKLNIETYNEGYRGIHAKENIKKGEIILKLPIGYLITNKMASENNLNIKKISEINDLRYSNHSQIAFYMLIDKEQENPKFKSYYDVLPETLNIIPYFWSEDELSLLENSPFLKMINQKKNSIEEDYNKIVSYIPEFRRFNFEQFLFEMALVISRNFSINVDGIKVNAMVPVADMLNHDRLSKITWTFDNQSNSFTLTTNFEINAGEVMTDSYGAKNNYAYLSNYGFILPEKNIDFINLEIDGQNYNLTRKPKRINKNLTNLRNDYDEKIRQINNMTQKTINIKNILYILKQERDIINSNILPQTGGGIIRYKINYR